LPHRELEGGTAAPTTHPDPDVSPNGKDIYLGYVFPLTDTDSKNRCGGAEADEKMPLWYFLGAIHQATDGKWKYNSSSF